MSHAMSCMATQDGWVMVKSSEKTWSTARGKDKTLQLYCCENPMNNMKRSKDTTLEMSPPGLMVFDMLPGQLLLAPERMKWLGQSGNDTQLWMCLVVKVKSSAVKNNTA